MSINRKKNNTGGEDNNNIFWTTMSDLMLGLCIIFMTLFILAMTGFTQETIKQQQQQAETAKELAEKLKVEKIDAEVDISGNVKISDVQLFELGSYTLSPNGKRFLDKFTPIYFDTILGNEGISENVENIVIQGHTDSHTFRDAKTPNEQFTRNMLLSLQRAYAVQEYMLSRTNYKNEYNKDLRKKLVVEGKSFEEPVLNAAGQEDFLKSRRVELKLRVKGSGIRKMFGLDFGGN